MGLTNVGRDILAWAITRPGEVSASIFTSSTSYIGVGSNSGAFANTQTALSSAISSSGRVAMDSGYPTVSGGVMTFRSTFQNPAAVGDWLEWGVFNASSGGNMLNRKVEYLGSKPNNQTWQFTVTITLTVP